MGATTKPWGQTKPPLGWQVNSAAASELGLVAAWLLNEGGGATVYDLIHGFPLAFNGAPKWNPGALGGSSILNAATSSLGFVASPPQLAINANFSVGVWFTPAAAQGNTFPGIVCSDNDSGTGTGWMVGFNGATTEFGITGPSETFISSATSLSTGRLHFGVVTVANGTTTTPKINIYADGLLQLSTTGSYAFTQSNGSGDLFCVGNDAGSGSSTGGAWAGNIEAVLIGAGVWTFDQASRLWADPFYWVQAPKRRLWNSVSSGTPVTVSFGLAAESLATQKTTPNLPAETIGSILTSRTLPAETLASQKALATVPGEWLWSIVSAVKAPAETLAQQKLGIGLPVETTGLLATTRALPTESLATQKTVRGQPAEFLASQRVGSASPTEWLAAVRYAPGLPVETTGGVQVTVVTPLPVEASGSISTARGQPTEWAASLKTTRGVPTEWTASQKLTLPLPDESLARQSVSIRTPVEWSGSLAVTVTSLLPVETLGRLAAAAPLRVETTASVKSVSKLPLEATSAVASRLVLPAEWRATVLASQPLPVEVLQTTAVVTLTAGLPVEWLATSPPPPVLSPYPVVRVPGMDGSITSVSGADRSVASAAGADRSITSIPGRNQS